MCYRIRHISSVASVLDFLPEAEVDPQININFEADSLITAFSHPMYPVIVHSNGRLRLRPHSWGITGKKTIGNAKERAKYLIARKENVLTPGYAWHGIRHKRCLVPVSAVFEHRAVSGVEKKVPYAVRQQFRETFFLPGLFHDDTVNSFCIITTAANDVMRQIHNDGDNRFRMPLFLTPELETAWVDPELTESDMRTILDYSIPNQNLFAQTVFSTHHKSVRHDGKSIIDRFDWPQCPAIIYHQRSVV